MKKSAKKKGFILAYSVVIMSLVTILLATAVGLLQSSVKLGTASVNEFYDKLALEQIAEYVEAGDYGAAYGVSVQTGYYFEYTPNVDSVEVVVHLGNKTCLSMAVKGDKVLYKYYGEKR